MARLPKPQLAGRKRAILNFIRTNGLLLQSDAELASVAGMVAEEPIKGSWWSHERAHDIYDVCVWLASSPDILELKLVKGKVTHVHRDLWPAVYTIATSDGPWQTGKLSHLGKRLLGEVERFGSVRSDEYRQRLQEPRRLSATVRELERRLLILSTEFHTDAGAHAKRLGSWPSWAQAHGVTAIPPDEAKRRILAAVAALGTDTPASCVPFS